MSQKIPHCAEKSATVANDSADLEEPEDLELPQTISVRVVEF